VVAAVMPPLGFTGILQNDRTKENDMVRKIVTLTVVMWIGLAGVPAHAASSGGGSWTAAVIAWLTQALSGGEIQPDDNGVIHLD